MALGLVHVFRLQQQPHVDGREPCLFESCGALDEVRTRGPREIVDVILHEAVRGLAGRRIEPLLARRPWRRRPSPFGTVMRTS